MEFKKNKNGGRHIKVQKLRNDEMKAALGAEDQSGDSDTIEYKCGVSDSQCDNLIVKISTSSLQQDHHLHTVDIIKSDISASISPAVGTAISAAI